MRPSPAAPARCPRAGLSVPQRPMGAPRVRALILAAPACGLAFAGGGLRGVNMPVQLWVAERDERPPHRRHAEGVRRALPIAPEIHVVEGASPFIFLTACRGNGGVADEQCPDADRNAGGSFRDRFNREVARFVRTSL